MAFKLFSDVRETTTAPGTGAMTLAGALDATYFSFSAKYSNGDTMFYGARGAAGREIGLGTYSAGVLTRTQVYKSTNGNAAVNFSSGAVDVYVTNIAPSDLDAAGLALQGFAMGAAQLANNLSDLPAKFTALDNLSLHGADIAAAATLNLDAATGSFVHVTGATTIAAITLSDGRQRTVYFTGAPLLTNGASLVLPGGINIQAQAGDIAVFISDSGTVRCTDYLSATAAGARALLNVEKKNYIVNGAMMVSQENGTTAASTTFYYPVDQFLTAYSFSGVATAAQVASFAPSGSPNRIRFTVTTADASVTATKYYCLIHRIEGLRSVDLKLGFASAKTVTLQFGVRAPAGTYCVILLNSAWNRSYVAEYTITAGEANTDVIKSAVIALDQAGSWLTSANVGIELRWGLMAGSNYQQTAGSWSTGNVIGSANQFNFMGTNGNVFELFDIGLYEGSVAPAFKIPDFQTELAACQRYFEPFAYNVMIGQSSASYYISHMMCFAVPKRASPTINSVTANATNANAVAFSATVGSVLVYATSTLASSLIQISGSANANARM